MSKDLNRLFISVVIIIGVLAGVFYVLDPVIERTMALNTSFRAKREAVAQYRSAASRVKALLAEYYGAPQLQEVVNFALPSAVNYDESAEILTRLADTNNLKIDFLASERIAGDRLGRNLIHAKLVGASRDFKNFIAAVERSLRLMDLLEWKFTHPNLAEAVIATYYQEAVPAVDAAYRGLESALILDKIFIDPAEVFHHQRFRNRN